MINDKGYINPDLLNGEDMTNVLADSHNLVIKQVPQENGSYAEVPETGTVGYDIKQSKIYLFINSHPLNKELYLISGYNGNVLKIASQLNNQTTFNYDSSLKKLYITSKGYCRGYLYELVGLKGA